MKKSREELKEYFETGDRPTEGQFSELIDSMIIQKDDEVWVGDGKKVGIGTSTPKARLDVAGNVRLQEHIYGDKRLALIINNTPPATSAQGLKISENGHVQIGTFDPNTPTAPQDRLNVQGNMRLQHGDLFLTAKENNKNNGLGWYGAKPFGAVNKPDTPNPDNRSQQEKQDDDTLKLIGSGPFLYGEVGGALGTKSNNRKQVVLSWNSANRVGIGTILPTERLHIQGNANIVGDLKIRGEKPITIKRYTVQTDPVDTTFSTTQYTAAIVGYQVENLNFGSSSDKAKWAVYMEKYQGKWRLNADTSIGKITDRADTYVTNSLPLMNVN